MDFVPHKGWESHSLYLCFTFFEFQLEEFNFVCQVDELQDEGGSNDIVIAEWIFVYGIFDYALLDDTDYANRADRNQDRIRFLTVRANGK